MATGRALDSAVRDSDEIELPLVRIHIGLSLMQVAHLSGDGTWSFDGADGPVAYIG